LNKLQVFYPSKMSLHLRSTLNKATLLVNRIGSSINGQKAALGQAAPAFKLQPTPDVSKFENNIVTSPYGDCELHDMTMVQKVFESASHWPTKIAMVYEFVHCNLIAHLTDSHLNCIYRNVE
jgi:hypothetical protein